MIDFHSHILPAVDDGSQSFETTNKLLKEARDAGFTKIISTSHYLKDYYEVNEAKRIELLKTVQEYNPNIELYLGSEVYVDSDMVQFIEQKEASTINNSNYVLFEFPLRAKPINAKETIYRLIENNYIPIIAHPERYIYVQEDLEFIEELADMGALLQANYGSIVGMYGKKAEKTLKKLLKEDLISFLGTDVHRVGQIYPGVQKAIKKIRKIVSEERLEELTTLNAEKVLNNEEIEI